MRVAEAYAREHAEPAAADAPPLVIDRQRVVHSAAFRRLQYKTQVFVALDDDHYRTRLTHTLEVAHLARRIADGLVASGVAADPALAEVAALAHDLGHPPFGHAGERALDECVRRHTGGVEGFEHNAHALRVVDYLEHPYPAFRGLNLTRVLRECLAKHTTAFDVPGPHSLQDGRPPPLEGQIAALADRLTYTLHDLQDGVYAQLLAPHELSGIELWDAHYRGPDAAVDPRWRGHIRPTTDAILATLLRDAVDATAARLQSAEAGVAAVGLSDALQPRLEALASLLLHRLYRNPRLVRMDSKARRMLTQLFDAYIDEPNLMPERFAARVAEQGAARVATDYVAGMTDRFCLREHARLFDPTMDV